MKLLVVEDEHPLLQSIIDYFTEEDFLCEGAATFSEALRLMEDFDYDCIILDINLPGGSGFDLLNYLRSYKKEEGVIIISTRNSLDDKLAGLNLGADDYLTKPVHLSELSARVKALIRRKYFKGSNFIDCNHIRLDLDLRSATCNGQPRCTHLNLKGLPLKFPDLPQHPQFPSFYFPISIKRASPPTIYRRSGTRTY